MYGDTQKLSLWWMDIVEGLSDMHNIQDSKSNINQESEIDCSWMSSK